MAMNVAINGLGTVGRQLLKALCARKAENGVDDKFSIKLVNDMATPENMKYLLEHDTIYGPWDEVTISSDESTGNTDLLVGNQRIRYTSTPKLSNLSLDSFHVDIVFECSGFYKTSEAAHEFIAAGAKEVVIMSGVSDNTIPMIVYDINHKRITSSDKIICIPGGTTIANAVVGHAINDIAGYNISVANFLEIGSNMGAEYLDTPVKSASAPNYQTGRSGAWNLIRSTSGAAKAIGRIIPELNGKFISTETRTATIQGTMSIGVCLVSNFDLDAFNGAFKTMVNDNKEDTVIYEEMGNAIVSSDVVGSSGVWYCANATYQQIPNEGSYLVTIPVIYDPTMVQISNAIASVVSFVNDNIWW